MTAATINIGDEKCEKAPPITTTTTFRQRHSTAVKVGATAVCLLTVALLAVAIGLLAAATNINNTTKEIYSRYIRNHETVVNESLYKDTKDGSVWYEYHLQEPERETWAINDVTTLTKQVIKLKLESGKFACVIVNQPNNNNNNSGSPINATYDWSTYSTDDTHQTVNVDANLTAVTFTLTRVPDNETASLLTPVEMKFCEGLDLYVTEPSQQQRPPAPTPRNDDVIVQSTTKPQLADKSVLVRRKRQYYFCLYNWLSCRFFSFTDVWGNNVRYYGCDMTCNWVS